MKEKILDIIINGLKNTFESNEFNMENSGYMQIAFHLEDGRLFVMEFCTIIFENDKSWETKFILKERNK